MTTATTAVLTLPFPQWLSSSVQEPWLIFNMNKKQTVLETAAPHGSLLCLFFFFLNELLRAPLEQWQQNMSSLCPTSSPNSVLLSPPLSSQGAEQPHIEQSVWRMAYVTHYTSESDSGFQSDVGSFVYLRIVCLKAWGVRCQWRSLPAGPLRRVSVFTDLRFVSLFCFFQGPKQTYGTTAVALLLTTWKSRNQRVQRTKLTCVSAADWRC